MIEEGGRGDREGGWGGYRSACARGLPVTRAEVATRGIDGLVNGQRAV